MAIDQWGRFVPDYPNPSNAYNPMNYREELQKQRDALDHRLADFDRRYQQPSPQTMPTQETPSSNKPTQPYIIVSSEKEAFDYPILSSINDQVGKVYIFAMQDNSAIFAKRINPSNFEMEFEAYDKRNQSESCADSSDCTDEKTSIFSSIDARLQKIEQFIDGVALFMGNQSPPLIEEPTKAKAVKASSKDKEGE